MRFLLLDLLRLRFEMDLLREGLTIDRFLALFLLDLGAPFFKGLDPSLPFDLPGLRLRLRLRLTFDCFFLELSIALNKTIMKAAGL